MAEVSGVFASPQMWFPTFGLTFPWLQLGIVLGLGLPQHIWAHEALDEKGFEIHHLYLDFFFFSILMVFTSYF